AAQLLVDQGQELLRGVRVALLDGGQDAGHLAHRGTQMLSLVSPATSKRECCYDSLLRPGKSMSRSAYWPTVHSCSRNLRKGDTKPMSRRAYAIPLLIVLGAIPASSQTPPPSGSAPQGIDVATMDKSVAPGDDFYTSVNGGWLRATQIPPD